MSLTLSTSTLQDYPARYLAAWNQRDIATPLVDANAGRVAIGLAGNSAGGQ